MGIVEVWSIVAVVLHFVGIGAAIGLFTENSMRGR